MKIDAHEQKWLFQRRKLIEEQLAQESKLVSEDSMHVLNEFEQFDDEV